MQPVILDCDPGHDDALALLVALASDEIELLGVSTVAGNQTVALTTANALAVLEYVGRGDLPVASGANRPLVRELAVAADVHGETGLDGAEIPASSLTPHALHAIDWIATTVRSSAVPVTIVATGPLTNIALLLARYPGVEAQIARIVMMGGSIGEGNVTPAAEFNVWADPEAAHRVMTSGLAVTMVGLDVTHQALLTEQHLTELAAAGHAGRLVANLYDFYLRYHVERYGWNGAPAHDALAMAFAIDAATLTVVPCGVVVDTGSDPSRGRTYVDRWAATGWPINAQVAVDVDKDRFLHMVCERVGRLG